MPLQREIIFGNSCKGPENRPLQVSGISENSSLAVLLRSTFFAGCSLWFSFLGNSLLDKLLNCGGRGTDNDFFWSVKDFNAIWFGYILDPNTITDFEKTGNVHDEPFRQVLGQALHLKFC